MIDKDKGWRMEIVEYEEGRIQGHVMPVDDIHDHDTAPDCWCNPDACEEVPCIEGTAQLFLHNSADRREDHYTETKH